MNLFSKTSQNSSNICLLDCSMTRRAAESINYGLMLHTLSFHCDHVNNTPPTQSRGVSSRMTVKDQGPPLALSIVTDNATGETVIDVDTIGTLLERRRNCRV